MYSVVHTWLWSIFGWCGPEGAGGRGAAIHGLYRYVPLRRV